MREPLTASQQQLRGCDVRNLTLEQLSDWIDACEKMELWVKPATARRSWKIAGADARAELQRRGERAFNGPE